MPGVKKYLFLFLVVIGIAYCRNDITLVVESGSSIRIFQPVTVTDDSLFANTLELRYTHENSHLVNIRAEGMDKIIQQKTPIALMGFSLDEISGILIENQKKPALIYLTIMTACTAIGYSLPIGNSKDQLDEDRTANRVMFSAAGLLLGYYISEHVADRNTKTQTFIDLSTISNTDKADLLQKQNY